MCRNKGVAEYQTISPNQRRVDPVLPGRDVSGKGAALAAKRIFGTPTARLIPGVRNTIAIVGTCRPVKLLCSRVTNGLCDDGFFKRYCGF